MSNREEFLRRLGQRVRCYRKQRGMTLKELSSATGLSVRFLTQLEAGQGNIAVGRLAMIAEALQIDIGTFVSEPGMLDVSVQLEQVLKGRSEAELRRALRILETVFGSRQRKVIGLLGLRGAGKTTIGGLLARQLSVPFWELDDRIEELAGLSLSEIFALHGESYYRRLEAQALVEVLSEHRRCVLALPGGIVSNSDSFEIVRLNCFTVWLKAYPEDHMYRVLMQGDRRPMANRPDALAELKAILAAREPFYQMAELHVHTSQLGLEKSVEFIVTELEKRGWR